MNVQNLTNFSPQNPGRQVKVIYHPINIDSGRIGQFPAGIMKLKAQQSQYIGCDLYRLNFIHKKPFFNRMIQWIKNEIDALRGYILNPDKIAARFYDVTYREFYYFHTISNNQ